MPKSITRVSTSIDVHIDGDIYVLNQRTGRMEFVGSFTPQYEGEDGEFDPILYQKNWKKFINAFKR